MSETDRLSSLIPFSDVDWNEIPADPGTYVIYEGDEVIYVGMSGRNGKGNLRNRLRDHRSGQIVNVFAQYLFLARVQLISKERITDPRAAKAAYHKYIIEHCSFRYAVTKDGAEARQLENRLKLELRPSLNP